MVNIFLNFSDSLLKCMQSNVLLVIRRWFATGWQITVGLLLAWVMSAWPCMAVSITNVSMAFVSTGSIGCSCTVWTVLSLQI